MSRAERREGGEERETSTLCDRTTLAPREKLKDWGMGERRQTGPQTELLRENKKKPPFKDPREREAFGDRNQASSRRVLLTFRRGGGGMRGSSLRVSKSSVGECKKRVFRKRGKGCEVEVTRNVKGATILGSILHC